MNNPPMKTSFSGKKCPLNKSSKCKTSAGIITKIIIQLPSSRDCSILQYLQVQMEDKQVKNSVEASFW